MSGHLVPAIEWIFLAYFAAINLAYLVQCLFAVRSVRRYLKSSAIDDLDPVYSTVHLPISLVVPAYNESRSIVTSIKALLQLEYPDFEVVVVNDGSTDDTLEKLIAGFQLYPYPEAYRKQVPCQAGPDDLSVRALSQSARRRQGKRRLQSRRGQRRHQHLPQSPGRGRRCGRRAPAQLPDARGTPLSRESGNSRGRRRYPYRQRLHAARRLPRGGGAATKSAGTHAGHRVPAFVSLRSHGMGAARCRLDRVRCVRRVPTHDADRGRRIQPAGGRRRHGAHRSHPPDHETAATALSHRFHSRPSLLDRCARESQGPRQPAHSVASRTRSGANAEPVAHTEPARRHRLLARDSVLCSLRAARSRHRSGRASCSF